MKSAPLPKLPTERRFGLTFAVIFELIGLYGVLRSWQLGAVTAWLVVGLMFGIIAVTTSSILAPLNRAWFRLGELLGRIVSPVVLGILFFGLLTPVALVARLFGRDELRLKRRLLNTYWIDRVPPGPTGQSFKNQF